MPDFRTAFLLWLHKKSLDVLPEMCYNKYGILNSYMGEVGLENNTDISEIDISKIDPKSLTDAKLKELIRDYSIKHNVKDSVFKCLFGDKEYLLMLYKELHPEDNEVSCENLESITINSPIINQMCNDLGFIVKDKLIILAEAQSTWTENICFRMFLYLAETYVNYVKNNRLNLYHEKVKLPKPELYVIYTGDTAVPKELSLNKEFFNDTAPVDVRVSVINDANLSNITGQYIIFSKTYDSQRKILKYIKDTKKRNKTAMQNTIKICRENGVLIGFVNKYKEDLCDMVSVLHDTDYLLDLFESECKAEGKAEGIVEGKAEGKVEKEREIIERLRSKGYSDEKIREILY